MSNKIKTSSDLNWIVIAILIFLPIFVICGVTMYCMEYGFGWKEAILGIVTYYMANISVGVGSHRLWSHGSYKTTKFVELILMIINSGTLQGPILAWAADHKKHHSYADTDKDPHTPANHESKWKGFWWAHMGWMCVGEITAQNIDKGTMATLGKNKMLKWQLDNYVSFATFMNIVPPMVFGWIVFGGITLQATLAGLFFVGLGRFLQQQMTFSVNSVCHMLGSRQYANDSSGDVWWLFFLLLGENWHNFHHAFGRDYRNGHRWYQFDVHKWIIALMAKCGLAWDLVITPKERIEARMVEMRSDLRGSWQKKLEDVEVMAIRLRDLAKQKIASASGIADIMTTKARVRISDIERSAVALAESIKEIVSQSEKMSDKIVQQYMRKLQELKKAAERVGLQLQ